MTRILVVDDCAVDRALAGQLLKRETSWTIEFAKCGEEALEMLKSQPPNLVVTDLQMPGIDGLELVSIIHEKYPRVPVILMTAQGSEEIAHKALIRGAASYVPKAILPDHLLETAQRVLQMSAQESSHRKVLDCLTRSESDLSLANDSTLFAPLIQHFQEQCMSLGICNQADRVRVGVALAEALANAMYHGNLELSSALRESDADAYHNLAETRRREPPYRERRITMTAKLVRGKAVFAIRDEGPGFDPTSLPDPTDPANLEKVSGRGILLMQSFMDQVEFDSRGNGVTLVKQGKLG